MSYGEFFQLLGITSGAMIGVAIVVIFLGKYLVQYCYDLLIERKRKNAAQELESFKSGLERDSRAFQHELNLRLERYNVLFSTLHQERAHIIKDMHSKLLELHAAIQDYTAIARFIKDGEDPEKAEQARIDRANKAIWDFNIFVLENCIYFEKPLAGKLDSIRKEYTDTAFDYMFLKQSMPGVSKEEYYENVEKWKGINTKIKVELQSTLEELEDEFRKLLGVNS